MNRIGYAGMPLDLELTRRFIDTIKNILPTSTSNYLFEGRLNRRFDHALYGLQPEHRLVCLCMFIVDKCLKW